MGLQTNPMTTVLCESRRIKVMPAFPIHQIGGSRTVAFCSQLSRTSSQTINTAGEIRDTTKKRSKPTHSIPSSTIRMGNSQSQPESSQQPVLATEGHPPPTSPEHRIWSSLLAFFLNCVSVDCCINDYVEPPLLDGSDVNCNLPRPQSPMTYQPTSTDRATSSTVPIKNATIRKRNGRWMVSHKMDGREEVFIQFPPLIEEDRSSDEGVAQAGSSKTKTKKSFWRGGSKEEERKKMDRKTIESDSEMEEWHFL